MSPWLRRDLVLLASLTLLVRVLSGLPLERPGYMDAAYYVDGALSLYEGRGFSDPFIWNYLDQPGGIPHPSHLYWMPLASMLGYLSFILLGPTYRAAQVPFALLSSLLPLFCYLAAYDVARNRRHAWAAGLFAALGGFYMAYWVTPDNFAPFAVTGSLCLWAAGRAFKTARPAWLAISGVGAGLAHLARADGLLLLAAVLVVAVVTWGKQASGRTSESADQQAVQAASQPVGGSTRSTQKTWLVSGCLLFVACYLLVMGPWLLRNVQVIGQLLPSAGTQTVWLTNYDDLYSYRKPLSAATYLAWGWSNIVKSKLYASWINAQTLLFVGWMICLAPFGLIGVWRLRRRVEFQAAWVYGGLLYVVMSWVFTFPGWRGGMLHSATALLPFLYAAAVEGLDAFVDWGARWRRTWQPRQAKRVLTAGLVVLVVALSVGLYVQGLDRFRGEYEYQEAIAWLDEHAPSGARILINDPPSFYYHSRRESLSIPNADLDTVLHVMAQYDACYLLLDENYTLLRALYAHPQSDERLTLLGKFGNNGGEIYVLALATGSCQREMTR